MRNLRPLALVVLAALGGCPAEPGRLEVREPRCEARSHSDPGRLTLETRAQSFGATPPCHAYASFAIAANSDLRALTTRIRLVDGADGSFYDEVQPVVLSGPRAGMWLTEVPVDATSGPACRALTLIVQIMACLDQQHGTIPCPAMRVRESQVLQNVELEAAHASVCYDD